MLAIVSRLPAWRKAGLRGPERQPLPAVGFRAPPGIHRARAQRRVNGQTVELEVHMSSGPGALVDGREPGAVRAVLLRDGRLVAVAGGHLVLMTRAIEPVPGDAHQTATIALSTPRTTSRGASYPAACGSERRTARDAS